jgi:hypothetical protein
MRPTALALTSLMFVAMAHTAYAQATEFTDGPFMVASHTTPREAWETRFDGIQATASLMLHRAVYGRSGISPRTANGPDGEVFVELSCQPGRYRLAVSFGVSHLDASAIRTISTRVMNLAAVNATVDTNHVLVNEGGISKSEFLDLLIALHDAQFLDIVARGAPIENIGVLMPNSSVLDAGFFNTADAMGWLYSNCRRIL